MQIRGLIREQLVSRDGEIMVAVASILHEGDLAQTIWATEEGGDLLGTVLQSSELRGVLGVRIFDAGGMYVGSVPFGLPEAEVTEEDWAQLLRLEPVSRYWGEVDLEENFGFELAHPTMRPTLEVAIPVYNRSGGGLDGIAVYLMDGQQIAHEFEIVDRNLWHQGLLAFGVGFGLLVAVTFWSFPRLHYAAAQVDDLGGTD